MGCTDEEMVKRVGTVGEKTKEVEKKRKEKGSRIVKEKKGKRGKKP